ncbi:MAG: Universal stress protein [Syntrophaceae bacterium PtaU1.Bin231]|nr:MAG: Universal stress protein [Syntrophaceae bacterium PtaU1.Bin231]
MFRDILIPTDGSDYSRTALEYGIYIAKRLDARLTGLHVIDIKVLQGPVLNDICSAASLCPGPEFFSVIEKTLEARADTILRDFRGRCEEQGLKPDVKKVTGIIDEEIVREGLGFQLILLAQRGEHYPLSHSVLLGSTAEAVVRKSSTPVLVTPVDFVEIESMGLAYDGSPPANHALRIAAELSDKTRWPLTVLIVTDQEKLSADLSAKVESALDDYMIDKDIIVLGGKEEKEILRFIDEGAVELMLMGTHGHSRFKELLLGSTTSHVVRKSRIPILLTR